jgi:hypothetical protein
VKELQQDTPATQKIPQKLRYSANDILRIYNWTNQRIECEDFNPSIDLTSGAAPGDTNTAFTYVCGTTAVHKQASLGGRSLKR